MCPENPDEHNFEKELVFSASRSSGPGGQNVNKVNTRVELRFNIEASVLLSDNEKKLVSKRLSSRINKDGFLILSCQTERTQYENRQKAIEKFHILLLKALTPVKKRIPTQPGIKSKLKRLESKKLLSRKKELRRPYDDL